MMARWSGRRLLGRRGMRVVLCAAMALLALDQTLQAAGQSVDVDVCDASLSYFDPNALMCRACSADEPAEGKVPDVDSPRDVIGNPTRCTCAPGYRRDECVLEDDGPDCTFKCTSCLAGGQAASQDGLHCMSCGSLEVDEALADCACPDGERLVDRDADGSLLDAKICVACPEGTRVFTEDSADGSYKKDLYACQSCPLNMEFNDQGSCVCKDLVEYVVTGVAELGEQQCVDAVVAAEVQQEAPEGLATEVTFTDVVTAAGSSAVTSVTVTPSLTFKHIFLRAATRCDGFQTADDLAYCSALANLCVLHHYSPRSRVCALYATLAAERATSVNNWAGWPLHMPFIQYASSVSATGVLSSTALEQTMSFDAGTQPGTFEHMEFILAKFSVNGTFLGIEELGWQFVYCGGGSQGGITSRPRWLKFGVSYSQDISCNLGSLLSAGEPTMYELYIVDAEAAKENALLAAAEADEDFSDGDASGAGASIRRNADALPTTLFPVPFRDENYETEGDERPNENLDGETSDDVLARRFFLYDTVSGVDQVGSDPKVIRYADTITLQISSQDNEPSKILPPVLSIHYSERQPAQFETDPELAQVEFRLEVQYTTDVSTFWTSVTVFFGICIVIVAVGSGLRCYNWSRRATREVQERMLTPSMCTRAIVYFAGVFTKVFFWFTLVFSMYWLLFFKLQDKVFALLPANTPRFRPDYDAHELMVTLCFIGQLVRVMEIVWHQTSVDVFFVDWEKPRKGSGRAGEEDDEENGGAGGGRDEDDFDDRGRRGRSGRGRHGDRDRGRGRSGRDVRSMPKDNLSVWRTVLIANEWSEIQVERKTNLMFSMIVLLALLRGAGLEYIATPQPTVAVLTPGEVNPVLHFANVMWWWLLVAAAQLLWRWAIWERYISEPSTTRFIDVATVAKVSCLIMEDRYHGYYLHCRSPFTYADGTMAELTEQLQKEEQGLTMDRGLDGCPEGNSVQTFELFVPAKWRKEYDDVYRSLIDEDMAERSSGAAARTAERGAVATPASCCPTCGRGRRSVDSAQRLITASRQLSQFIREFVQQTHPTHKHKWGQRTYLEKVFDTPPQMDGLGGAVGGGSLMFPDTEARFESVLFRGVEMDLLIFNMLTFAVCDLWFGNTLVSAFLTVLVNELVNYVRVSWGTSNIAAKTLVDDRFLG